MKLSLVASAVAALFSFSLVSAAPAPALDYTPAVFARQSIPDLSKLSPCALQCVIGTVSAAKCASPLDTKCICTPNFTNLASACLSAKCPLPDAIPALTLQRTMCPDLGLPDLLALSSCAQVCVIKTLGTTHCSGPLDKDCICGLPFKLNVGGCLLGCGLQDLAPAIQLEFGVCDPDTPGQCSATGLWKILQPQCWFGGW